MTLIIKKPVIIDAHKLNLYFSWSDENDTGSVIACSNAE